MISGTSSGSYVVAVRVGVVALVLAALGAAFAIGLSVGGSAPPPTPKSVPPTSTTTSTTTTTTTSPPNMYQSAGPLTVCSGSIANDYSFGQVPLLGGTAYIVTSVQYATPEDPTAPLLEPSDLCFVTVVPNPSQYQMLTPCAQDQTHGTFDVGPMTYFTGAAIYLTFQQAMPCLLPVS